MSFVEMEKHICPICGETHTHKTGIIINTYLRDIENPVTGYGLCEVHDKIYEDGYICLIEVANTNKANRLKQEDAIPTGNILHIKSTVLCQLTDASISTRPLAYIDESTFKYLTTLSENAHD